MKKMLKAVAVAGAAVMLIGTTAFAGENYSTYNTTVGKINGNGYSGYQTKAISGANGYIRSTSVGGDYQVDVRMNGANGNGAWLRNVDDGTNAEIPGNSKQKKDDSVRLQFSNDLTTTVDVQVSGSWKSN